VADPWGVPKPAARCATCDSPLVEITIDVDGAPLTMSSCSGCDVRSWRQQDDALDLPAVLDRVAPTKARR
jgi:hypothetical protein